MASIFGHAIAGYTIKNLISASKYPGIVILAILSALLPDIDVLGWELGVSYDSIWGHRGFTHSVLFAFLWALLIAIFYQKKQIVFIIIFVSTLSHGILDAMTTGGMGVGFFIPFDDSRYFLPFQVITVSPIGVRRFFSEWGLMVLLSEFIFIIIPCLLTLFLKKRLFLSKNKP